MAPAIDKLQSLGPSQGRDKISEGVQTAASKRYIEAFMGGSPTCSVLTFIDSITFIQY